MERLDKIRPNRPLASPWEGHIKDEGNGHPEDRLLRFLQKQP